MEAFARALRQLPTIIADNGGFDGSELISSLRAAHAKGEGVSRYRLAVNSSHSSPPNRSGQCDVLMICFGLEDEYRQLVVKNIGASP